MKALLALFVVIGTSQAFALNSENIGAQSIDTKCLETATSDLDIALCASIEAKLESLCGGEAGVKPDAGCKVELFNICTAQSNDIAQTSSCVDALQLN